jgi:hypothetical protein
VVGTLIQSTESKRTAATVSDGWRRSGRFHSIGCVQHALHDRMARTIWCANDGSVSKSAMTASSSIGFIEHVE